VEAIVALAIIAAVFFFFATPKASGAFLAEKRFRLEATKVQTLALADLIQKIETHQIPWDTIASSSPGAAVPIARDWTATYQFTIKRKHPDNTPNLLLVEATILLNHGGRSIETNSLTFCIKKT
jgi:hypothetical protein